MTTDGGRYIGPAVCLVCDATTARASLMKTGRVCIVCNTCRCQVFSRGDESDARMRERIKGAKTAAELETPAGSTSPPPAAPPAPAPAPAAPAAPVAKRASWGVGSW